MAVTQPQEFIARVLKNQEWDSLDRRAVLEVQEQLSGLGRLTELAFSCSGVWSVSALIKNKMERLESKIFASTNNKVKTSSESNPSNESIGCFASTLKRVWTLESPGSSEQHNDHSPSDSDAEEQIKSSPKF